jgi:tetratricopeptide (TPR) repeat protein
MPGGESMNERPRPPLEPLPIAQDFERRLQWGALPAALFLLMLASLGAIALYSSLAAPRTASGLPQDRDIEAARRLLEGRLRPPAQDLRFASALTGDALPDAEGAGHDRLAAARSRLERALQRHRLDPRALASLAHVELALRRAEAAEAHYRLALEFAPHYGEARLGLGLALAKRAERATDALERRRLQLRALAQFTAVPETDPVFASALYNRAVMAWRSGRREEARRLAVRYMQIDPYGPWPERLRTLLEETV